MWNRNGRAIKQQLHHQNNSSISIITSTSTATPINNDEAYQLHNQTSIPNGSILNGNTALGNNSKDFYRPDKNNNQIKSLEQKNHSIPNGYSNKKNECTLIDIEPLSDSIIIEPEKQSRFFRGPIKSILKNRKFYSKSDNESLFHSQPKPGILKKKPAPPIPQQQQQENQLLPASQHHSLHHLSYYPAVSPIAEVIETSPTPPPPTILTDASSPTHPFFEAQPHTGTLPSTLSAKSPNHKLNTVAPIDETVSPTTPTCDSGICAVTTPTNHTSDNCNLNSSTLDVRPLSSESGTGTTQRPKSGARSKFRALLTSFANPSLSNVAPEVPKTSVDSYQQSSSGSTTTTRQALPIATINHTTTTPIVLSVNHLQVPSPFPLVAPHSHQFVASGSATTVSSSVVKSPPVNAAPVAVSAFPLPVISGQASHAHYTHHSPAYYHGTTTQRMSDLRKILNPEVEEKEDGFKKFTDAIENCDCFEFNLNNAAKFITVVVLTATVIMVIRALRAQNK